MKKKVIPTLFVVALILVVVAIICISLLVKKYTPSKEVQSLTEFYGITAEDQVPIIYNYSTTESFAKNIDGEIYLDYKFVHENIDERYYWDAGENLLLYATTDTLYTATANSASYLKGKVSVDHNCVVVKPTSDSCYISISYLKIFSNFIYDVYDAPTRVVITTDYSDISTATIKKNTQVRVLGGIKSAILKEVSKSDEVTVLSTDTKWSQVMTDDGLIGYVQNKRLSGKSSKTVTSDYTEPTYDHVFFDGEISMVWHPMEYRQGSSEVAAALSSVKGVNVISPTWFDISDSSGNLTDLGSEDYVRYCHNQGIQVWALFRNFATETDYTADVLSHTTSRQYLINQIVAKALAYNLDGVNIDFETVDPSLEDSYIEFIRELAIKCHNNGIILSVDNYAPSNYTAFYNRDEQSLFADYVVIMAYDEHYAGSDAGSVASLSWTKDAVANTLKEVPANQTILAMPLYSRLWTLTLTAAAQESDVIDETSSYDVTSKAFGMKSNSSMLGSHFSDATLDEESGQLFVQWTDESGNIKKCWIETIESIDQRLALMDDQKLAGCAFWRLGFESDDLWDTVIKYVD